MKCALGAFAAAAAEKRGLEAYVRRVWSRNRAPAVRIAFDAMRTVAARMTHLCEVADDAAELRLRRRCGAACALWSKIAVASKSERKACELARAHRDRRALDAAIPIVAFTPRSKNWTKSLLIRVMLLVGLCGVAMAHTSNCSGDFNLRSHTLAPNRGEKSLMINNRSHFFQLPSPANSQGKNSTICIPQKNGNRNWGGFAFAAWRRRAPASIDAMLKDMRHWERHSLTVDDTIQEYFFARDPYTRLLSLYLQKVVSECTSGGQLGCSQGLRYLGLSQNPSFA